MGLFDKLRAAFGGKTDTPPADDKYEEGLAKTRSSFGERLNALFANFRTVDENFFDDLEEMLIEADVGYDMAVKLSDELREEAKLKKTPSPHRTWRKSSSLNWWSFTLLPASTRTIPCMRPPAARRCICLSASTARARRPPSASSPTSWNKPAKRCCWRRGIPSAPAPSSSCRNGASVMAYPSSPVPSAPIRRQWCLTP